jgi:hypothetical protein
MDRQGRCQYWSCCGLRSSIYLATTKRGQVICNRLSASARYRDDLLQALTAGRRIMSAIDSMMGVQLRRTDPSM